VSKVFIVGTKEDKMTSTSVRLNYLIMIGYCADSAYAAPR